MLTFINSTFIITNVPRREKVQFNIINKGELNYVSS